MNGCERRRGGLRRTGKLKRVEIAILYIVSVPKKNRRPDKGAKKYPREHEK